MLRSPIASPSPGTRISVARTRGKRATMTLEFHYLAEQPQALPMVADWYYEQWGHLVPDETQVELAAGLEEFLHRDRMPCIRLAMLGGNVVGAAQLKYREMQKMLPNLEHWIGGVYVAAAFRGRGFGSRIADDIAQLARGFGVRVLYLQTERLDGGLYRGLGWQPREQVNNAGLEVLVMERELL